MSLVCAGPAALACRAVSIWPATTAPCVQRLGLIPIIPSCGGCYAGLMSLNRLCRANERCGAEGRAGTEDAAYTMGRPRPAGHVGLQNDHAARARARPLRASRRAGSRGW